MRCERTVYWTVPSIASTPAPTHKVFALVYNSTTARIWSAGYPHQPRFHAYFIGRLQRPI